MFQLNYGYFRVYWNRCRPVELKKYIEVTSLQKMSTTMVAWLRKIVSWNCLQWLVILITFGGLANVYAMIRSQYKLGFLSNCLKLTSAFKFSSSLRDMEFRCSFYFFNDESWCWDNFRYFQAKSRLIFHLKLLCSFLWKVIQSKFTWHFLFLQFNPACFKTVLTMMLCPT